MRPLSRFLSAIFGLNLLCILAPSGLALPAHVILIRHAEKPANDRIIHLSETGRKRAEAIASWATNTVVLPTNAPVMLIAARPVPGAPSRRSIETLEPLALKLGQKIRTPASNRETAALASNILKDPEYDGKILVVCWTRDELPEFAKGLGVSAPPKWGKDTFNRYWLVTFRDGSAGLEDLPQNLMPGDSIK